MTDDPLIDGTHAHEGMRIRQTPARSRSLCCPRARGHEGSGPSAALVLADRITVPVMQRGGDIPFACDSATGSG